MSYDLSKILFIVSTSAASALSGLILSCSYLAIPIVLLNPAEANALRQWRTLYRIGAGSAPFISLTAATAAFGAAYTHYHPQASHRSFLFVTSGIATLSIVPWTFTAMMRTNHILEAKEDAANAKANTDGDVSPTTEDTKRLLRKWSVLNTIRGLFPLIGSLLAFEAL